MRRGVGGGEKGGYVLVGGGGKSGVTLRIVEFVEGICKGEEFGGVSDWNDVVVVIGEVISL